MKIESAANGRKSPGRGVSAHEVGRRARSGAGAGGRGRTAIGEHKKCMIWVNMKVRDLC